MMENETESISKWIDCEDYEMKIRLHPWRELMRVSICHVHVWFMQIVAKFDWIAKLLMIVFPTRDPNFVVARRTGKSFEI